MQKKDCEISNNMKDLLKAIVSIVGTILMYFLVEHIIDKIGDFVEVIEPYLKMVSLAIVIIVVILFVIGYVYSLLRRMNEKLILLKDNTKYKAIQTKIRNFKNIIKLIFFGIIEFFKGILIFVTCFFLIIVLLESLKIGINIFDFEYISIIISILCIISGFLALFIYLRNPE